MDKQIQQLLEARLRAARKPVDRADLCVWLICLLEGAEIKMADRQKDFIWFINTAVKAWFYKDAEANFLKKLEQIEKGDEDPAEALPEIPAEFASPEAGLTTEQINDYRRRYRQFMTGYVDLASIKGKPEEEYYGDVLRFITTFPEFKEDRRVQGYCVYTFLLDKRTPYYQMNPGLNMMGDEYKSVLKEINVYWQKAHFVMSLAHSQKTERASQLLAVLDEVSDLKEKAVLLGLFLIPPDGNKYRREEPAEEK